MTAKSLNVAVAIDAYCLPGDAIQKETVLMAVMSTTVVRSMRLLYYVMHVCLARW